MADYAFVTHWRIAAPIDAVWDAIYGSEDWPSWWGDVLRVDVLARGDNDGVGAVRRYMWKTALPYSFTFETRTTRIERRMSSRRMRLAIWKAPAAGSSLKRRP